MSSLLKILCKRLLISVLVVLGVALVLLCALLDRLGESPVVYSSEKSRIRSPDDSYSVVVWYRYSGALDGSTAVYLEIAGTNGIEGFRIGGYSGEVEGVIVSFEGRDLRVRLRGYEDPSPTRQLIRWRGIEVSVVCDGYFMFQRR